jgi:hypothetical protein
MTQKLFFQCLGYNPLRSFQRQLSSRIPPVCEDVSGSYQLMGGKKELKGKEIGDKNECQQCHVCCFI